MSFLKAAGRHAEGKAGWLCAALEADAPLELLLMPGLAFDEAGRRCGRGGGYYDKLLSRLRERAEHHGWEPPLTGGAVAVLSEPLPVNCVMAARKNGVERMFF